MTETSLSPYPPRKPMWTCPKNSCGKGNEPHRTTCISCGTPRPQ
jgi:hypothetical protein